MTLPNYAPKVHGNTRYGHDHKHQARALYVEAGVHAEKVAEEIGCSLRTVQTWIRENGWREARKGWTEVHAIPLEDLEERALRKVLSRLELEADHLDTKALLELLTNVNRFKTLIAKRQGYRLVDAALVVGDEFQAFILHECPEDAPRLLDAWRSFIDDLAKRAV
jgi:transposase-like protein